MVGADRPIVCHSVYISDAAHCVVALHFVVAEESQMTLVIDANRCQGHGRCSVISPELFDVTDDGLGLVLVPEPGPEQADVVARAVDNCPESAISDTARRAS
jgi:ferredoxin